jgi:hypothetical protein
MQSGCERIALWLPASTWCNEGFSHRKAANGPYSKPHARLTHCGVSRSMAAVDRIARLWRAHSDCSSTAVTRERPDNCGTDYFRRHGA